MKLTYFLILSLLYFGSDTGLSWWFKHRYGIDDNYIGAKAPDQVQRFFGKALYISLLYYLLVLVSLALGSDLWGLAAPITLLDHPALSLSGFVLGLLCLLLAVVVRFNLGASWRVGLDPATTDTLITHGFYRFSRNPYFSAFLGFQAAAILVAPAALTLCAVIQSAILLGLQVRQEEIFLETKYPNYLEYIRHTGRYLPRLPIRGQNL